MAAAEAAGAGSLAPTVEALAAELAVSATFGLSLAGTPAAGYYWRLLPSRSTPPDLGRERSWNWIGATGDGLPGR